MFEKYQIDWAIIHTDSAVGGSTKARVRLDNFVRRPHSRHTSKEVATTALDAVQLRQELTSIGFIGKKLKIRSGR
ncbi:MAG: hypothetical protein U0V48_16825 [Anaerolineales bacterium]